MGVLTNDKELQKLFDVTGSELHFVRHENSPIDNQAVASDLASLIKRVAASSVQEVDDVIVDLKMLREKLDGDAARMRRELAEFAAFGESTLQSMKVISESLRNNLRILTRSDRHVAKPPGGRMWAGWGGFGPSQPALLCPPF